MHRSLYLILLATVLLLSGAVLRTAAHSAERAAANGRVKSGTGFFVSRDGFLLTSAHVVDGCQSVSVWAPGGNSRPSYVVALDRLRDIALLWAEGASPAHAAMFGRVLPQQGDNVFTLGYGINPTQPLSAVVVEGSFVGGRVAEPGNRIVLIRAKLHAGNSGGALLAGDGSLVGMVVGRDQEHSEFGVAVPREDLEAMLSSYRIWLTPPEPGPSARNVLGDISVLIQCAGPQNAKTG